MLSAMATPRSMPAGGGGCQSNAPTTIVATAPSPQFLQHAVPSRAAFRPVRLTARVACVYDIVRWPRQHHFSHHRTQMARTLGDRRDVSCALRSAAEVRRGGNVAVSVGRLHVGHAKNYRFGDAIARMMRMRGNNVVHRWGGTRSVCPRKTRRSRVGSTRQLDGQHRQYAASDPLMGTGYDWSREFATCFPGYYRWNQWLFLRLFERGLAYKREAPVNWCLHHKTVLANEQVVDGRAGVANIWSNGGICRSGFRKSPITPIVFCRISTV